MPSIAGILKDSYAELDAKWHSIFDRLPPEKARLVKLCLDAFKNAWTAYQFALRDNKIAVAGDYGWYYLRLFEYIRFELLGRKQSDGSIVPATVEKTLETVQSVHEYLIGKGWTGIPVIEEGNKVIYKTAVQMHDDMLYYRRETHRLRSPSSCGQTQT